MQLWEGTLLQQQTGHIRLLEVEERPDFYYRPVGRAIIELSDRQFRTYAIVTKQAGVGNDARRSLETASYLHSSAASATPHHRPEIQPLNRALYL